jgi:hypothetical protein
VVAGAPCPLALTLVFLILHRTGARNAARKPIYGQTTFSLRLKFAS